MKTQRYPWKVYVAILFVCITATSLCQVNVGSLAGIVTDSTGAAIPDAHVTLSKSGIETKIDVTTNSEGNYVFSDLFRGEYTISVSHPSFKSVVRSGLVLNAGSKIRVDITLDVGQTTETVNVNGNTPLIEERGVGLSTVIDQPAVQKLPVVLSFFKRDPMDFLNTVPGVQNGHINGTIGSYSEVLIDGAPAECNAGVRGNLRNNNPGPDSVAELKVSNDPAADAGYTGGAIVSLVIKSGTNELHGSVYDYTRNTIFDAKNYFAATRAADHQSEFGGTLGGPVILPHIYNGRGKTFFFFAYGDSIYRQAQAGVVKTLPTASFRNGDFSALLGSQVGTDLLGRPVFKGEIYDPSTTRQVTAGQIDPSSGRTASGTGAVRDPFNGNIVPQGSFSPISVKYQALFPAPTIPNLIANNFVGTAAAIPVDQWTLTTKIDHIWSKDRLAVTYYHGHWDRTVSNVLPMPLNDFRHIYPTDNNTRVNYSHTFSANMENSFIASLDRDTSPSQPNPVYKQGNSQVGVKGLLATCTPQTTIDGGYGGFGIGDCGAGEANTNYRFIDNFSLLTGKHSLKFGGNFARWIENKPVAVNSMGLFNFSGRSTALPGTFLSQTGAGYASLLLGSVDSSSLTAPQYDAERLFSYGAYVQDEYRVTRNLTLSLGLRWDVQPFFVEEHDAFSNFDKTVKNPGAGNILGALTFPGVGPGRTGQRRILPTRFGDIGPRIGIAYKFLPNSVFRASYGIYYGPVSDLGAGFVIMNRQGYFPSFAFTSSDGFTPSFNWSNGFPLPANIGPTLDPTVANGSATAFWGPLSNRAPRIQTLSVVIQHQLPKQVLLSATYFRNAAHGLGSTNGLPANQLDYKKFGAMGSLLTANINSAQAQAAGIPSPYPGFTGTVAQALRPFPQYQVIQDQGAGIGNSIYDSLQLTVQKQFSGGLSFLAGYTIGKWFSDQDDNAGLYSPGPQDAYNRRAEWALTADDVPQQLVFNYTYDLPFGPGKKFANSTNGFARQVFGGWSIAGIHKYQSGPPILLSTNQQLPTGAVTLRPDVVPNVNIRTNAGCGSLNPRTDVYLNAGAFKDPAPYTFGNAPRRLGNVRGCALLNENFSLSKSFPLHREKAIEFGADAFNLFNRHYWGVPAANIDNRDYGTITTASAPRTIQLHGRIRW